MESLLAYPNVYEFYREVNIGLENLFVGCKSVDRIGDTRRCDDLGKAALGFSLVAKVVSSIPLCGSVLGGMTITDMV